MPPESTSPSPPALAAVRRTSDAASPVSELRQLLRMSARSALGRVALAAVLFKVVVGFFGPTAPAWARLLDSAGTVVLAVALGVVLLRVVALLQRRLLWRVRRKLVLSYLLIGFVPILLLVSFFLLAGTLLLSTVTSLLVQLRFEDLVDDADGLARAVAVDLRAHDEWAGARELLERRVVTVAARYPEASVVLLPPSDGPSRRGLGVGPSASQSGGAPPPEWVGEPVAGLVLTGVEQTSTVVARGATAVELAGRSYVVVADLPISGAVVDRMQEATGVRLLQIGPSAASQAPPGAVPGGLPAQVVLGSAGEPLAGGLPSASFLDLLDWDTGLSQAGAVTFEVRPAVFYRQVVQGGDFSFAFVLIFGLMVIGAMFLTIEAVALVMGFALARSITGAVHELFTGTERVRRGDLDHRIQVESRDQLGELAESFNSMTGSIAELLEQAEEKRRLEEELRIAREIQMSLLPDGPVSIPGLVVTAVCRPAREVGGDYYDFVPLGEHRLGVLVADVSGKGTSAAFYMAELKGLILALGEIYDSPKRLLVEVNRILSANLDTRTFITMIYAVLDLAAGTLTYARAGHTPLMYLPAQGPQRGRAQVLIPDGMVVGLQLTGIEERFAELLEERTIAVAPGDLFALFTDGITEAMNEELDLFGEERLGRLLEDHMHLPSSELRERILGDVEAFVGGADQHDDITMVLLRIEAVGGEASHG